MNAKSEADILRKNYLLATMAFLFKTFCEKFEELDEDDHFKMIKCFQEMAGEDMTLLWSDPLYNLLLDLNSKYQEMDNEDQES